MDIDNENNRKQLRNYGKYAAIAFQMLAIIGVFTFIGYKIDQYRQAEQPIFTAILGLLGVVASLYSILRAIRNNI